MATNGNGPNNLDPAVISTAEIDRIKTDVVPPLSELVTSNEMGFPEAQDILLGHIAEEHTRYLDLAGTSLRTASDELQAMREKKIDVAAVRGYIARGASKLKNDIRQILATPAREWRATNAAPRTLRSRLSALKIMLTGSPEAEVDVERSRGLWGIFTRNAYDIVPLLLLIVVEVLVGLKAFAYFSDDRISLGITAAVLYILYAASKTVVRYTRMKATRDEAERERDSYCDKMRASSNSLPAIFKLPHEVDRKLRLARLVFWGTLAGVVAGRVIAVASQDKLDPSGLFATAAFVLLVAGSHALKLTVDRPEYPQNLITEYHGLDDEIEKAEAKLAADPFDPESEHGKEIALIADEYRTNVATVTERLTQAHAADAALVAALSRMLEEFNSAGSYFTKQTEESAALLIETIKRSMADFQPGPEVVDVAAAYAAKAPQSLDVESVNALIADEPAPFSLTAIDVGQLQWEAWEEIHAYLEREEKRARNSQLRQAVGIRPTGR